MRVSQHFEHLMNLIIHLTELLYLIRPKISVDMTFVVMCQKCNARLHRGKECFTLFHTQKTLNECCQSWSRL